MSRETIIALVILNAFMALAVALLLFVGCSPVPEGVKPAQGPSVEIIQFEAPLKPLPALADPSDPEELIRHATWLAGRGKLDEALAELREAEQLASGELRRSILLSQAALLLRMGHLRAFDQVMEAVMGGNKGLSFREEKALIAIFQARMGRMPSRDQIMALPPRLRRAIEILLRR